MNEFFKSQLTDEYAQRSVHIANILLEHWTHTTLFANSIFYSSPGAELSSDCKLMACNKMKLSLFACL